MNYLGGNDLQNMKYNPTFFGYYINDKLTGVNSGHMTMDNKYRSRGLYVFPEYRGKGIGIELLLAAIKQGKNEDAKLCWSFPRQESVNTYLSVGFTLSSDFATSETGTNAYCFKKY
jgi:GNAT superfamily N-acetyltransferase